MLKLRDDTEEKLWRDAYNGVRIPDQRKAPGMADSIVEAYRKQVQEAAQLNRGNE